MLSYRNALCAFAVTTLLLTITSMGQLRAGELVQFDAVSADAGSLRLLSRGYAHWAKDMAVSATCAGEGCSWV
jgi:hypothetical protein